MNDKPIGFAVAYGNAFDGLTLYGLFDTHEEAEQYADVDNPGDSDWTIVPVYKKD